MASELKQLKEPCPECGTRQIYSDGKVTICLCCNYRKVERDKK